MSQIREAFIDSSTNNRLNEYGGGESGLTSQNPGAGTQRKFSDYYNREFKVIKELTNPDAQLPVTGTRISYNLANLFTSTELTATNQKIINIRDPGKPIGIQNPGNVNTGLPSGIRAEGVFKLDLNTFNKLGNITINNYASIYGHAGKGRASDEPIGESMPLGGSIFGLVTPASAESSLEYKLTINNYGDIRAGGGGGGIGGDGGEGQYVLPGPPPIPGRSSGTVGGRGGDGAGYIPTSPYYNTNRNGFDAAVPTLNAGRGGRGGNGGDWGQSGQNGTNGADGVDWFPFVYNSENNGILPSESYEFTHNMVYTLGAPGAGTQGYNFQGAGDGGDTTVTFNFAGKSHTVVARGGGGAGQSIAGAGGTFTTFNALGTHASYCAGVNGGNGYSVSNQHGGAGGSIGQTATGFSSSIANISSLPGKGNMLGAYIFDLLFNKPKGSISKQNSSAYSVLMYASLNINSSSSFGQLSNFGNLAAPGGTPARWGGGGGGGERDGGNGGDGNLGGGGGGGAGDRNDYNYAIYWLATSSSRTVTSLLNWDLSDAIAISIKVLRANGSWGDPYEFGEGPVIEYSFNNGSTWQSLPDAIVGPEDPSNWYMKTWRIGNRLGSGSARFRVTQPSRTGTSDQWAIGPAFIHYGNGTVDYLWNPYSIPGTFYTISGTEDVDYRRWSILYANVYWNVGTKPPNLQSKGGDGGAGFIFAAYLNANGEALGYFFDTAYSEPFTYLTRTIDWTYSRYISYNTGGSYYTDYLNNRYTYGPFTENIRSSQVVNASFNDYSGEVRKVCIWAAGGGGGGSGAPAIAAEAGGGGGAGGLVYTEWDVVGYWNNLVPGDTAPIAAGAPGWVVFWHNPINTFNYKPTLTLSNAGTVIGENPGPIGQWN